MTREAFDRGPSYGGNSFAFGLVFGLIELWIVAMILILAAAFTMGLLGANPDAGFAVWIYARTAEIMRPFNGLFDPVTLTGGTVLRPSLLFAMAVYAVVGSVIAAVGRRLNSSW